MDKRATSNQVHISKATFRRLWTFLFREIDTAKDVATLRFIGDLLDVLLPVLEPSRNGIGQELWLWLGLREDGAEGASSVMADDYRQMILDEFPDLVSLPIKKEGS